MNPEKPSREEIEARLTALLLGELPADEAQLLRWTIAQDAALAQLHDELKLTIELVREVAAHPATAMPAQNVPLKLSDERREKLLAHFKTVAPPEFTPLLPPLPKRREISPLIAMLAVVALIAVLAAMLLPALSASKSKATRIMAMNEAKQQEMKARLAADDAIATAAPQIATEARIQNGEKPTLAPPPAEIVLPQVQNSSAGENEKLAAATPAQTEFFGSYDVAVATPAERQTQMRATDIKTVSPEFAFNGGNNGGAGSSPAGNANNNDSRLPGVNSLLDQNVQVVTVQNANPQEAAQELQKMFGGNPAQRGTTTTSPLATRSQQTLSTSGTSDGAQRASELAGLQLQPSSGVNLAWSDNAADTSAEKSAAAVVGNNGGGNGGGAAGGRRGGRGAAGRGGFGGGRGGGALARATIPITTLPSASPPAPASPALGAMEGEFRTSGGAISESDRGTHVAGVNSGNGWADSGNVNGGSGGVEVQDGGFSNGLTRDEVSGDRFLFDTRQPAVAQNQIVGESRFYRTPAPGDAADKVPMLGDVPNLGSLFKSQNVLINQDGDVHSYDLAGDSFTTSVDRTAPVNGTASTTLAGAVVVNNGTLALNGANSFNGGIRVNGDNLAVAKDENGNKALGFDWYLGNFENRGVVASGGSAPSANVPVSAANPLGTFPGNTTAGQIAGSQSDQLITSGLRNSAPAPIVAPPASAAAPTEAMARLRAQRAQELQPVYAGGEVVNNPVQAQTAPPIAMGRITGQPAPTVASADAGTYVQNGKLLYEMGKVGEAEAQFNEALKVDPANQAATYYSRLAKQSSSGQEEQMRTVDTANRLLQVEKGTSAGRQIVESKLDKIRLDASFDGLPLSEVIQRLSDQAKLRDPDKKGINFLINNNNGATEMMAGQVNPATGLPSSAGNGAAGDIRQTVVSLNAGLTDVRLADVLDAIVQTSSQPIKYSVEDYGIVFSPRSPDAPQLSSRTFKIDPNTFYQGLQSVTTFSFGGTGNNNGGGSAGRGSAPVVNVAQGGGDNRGPFAGGGLHLVTSPDATEGVSAAAQTLFKQQGVDLTTPGKSVFFNDRLGLLSVRGTEQDLDTIQSAVQAMANSPTAVPVKVGNVATNIPNNAALVTQIIPIENVDVQQLVKDISPFASSKAIIVAASGNSIVITDTQANIRNLAKIIQSIDSSAATGKKTTPPTAPVPTPEISTRENAFSTFSLNVSDVSFKLAAASLEKGQLPDAASIRTEEFINAFNYRDPEPAAGVPVAFVSERARYPFAQNRDLLRFSLKTAAAGRQPGRPLNLVLLLDDSGSMERADRVAIIHEALKVLASQLQPQDTLSIVTFARTARLWVDGARGDQVGTAVNQVSDLTPEGGTNVEEAMNLAYATARRHYLANGVNRVVLLTDGAANLGNVNPEALKQKVESFRKQGIALDCFGIGWEGYNDDLLEVLSSNGDGRYGFINTPEAATTEFAAQFAGALHVAAEDVKVQVEFNPQRVISYRQIGYAKHQLTKEQFRDNTVAAAPMAAREAGNALYTVEVNPSGTGPVATVRVRFRIPGTTDVSEHEWEVPFDGNAPALEQSSPAMRLAATASAFSEWLASSPYAQEVTTDRLLNYLNGVPAIYGADARPKQLETMLREAKSLSGK